MQTETSEAPRTRNYVVRVYRRDVNAAVADSLRASGRWELLATNEGPWRPFVAASYDPATHRLGVEPRCPKWARRCFEDFVRHELGEVVA